MPAGTYSNGQILKAWAPYLILTIVILSWGLQPVKAALDGVGLVKFEVPGLHNAIETIQRNALPQVFKVNYLSAAGTAIFISTLITIPLVGIRYREAGRIFLVTLQQLRYPIISISSVLAFAYVVNNSGISITMAEALAGTGVFFPFFSPLLGWLGVFITGSDTSSNALFGKLQTATAESIGVDPVVAIGANTSGGVVGKMISPQSIAVAAAAGNLIGKESQLFRFTVKHSFIMLGLICAITAAQAYLFQELIPKYRTGGAPAATAVAGHEVLFVYLAIPSGLILLLIAMVIFMNRKKP